MPRIFLPLFLLLFVPVMAYAEPLEAIALGQIMPFVLIILLIGILIGAIGFTVAINDFYSARENPKRRNLVLIGLGVVAGTFFSLLSPLGRSHSYHYSASLFPNILTEIYVPSALLLIALKKFRFAQERASSLWWLGTVAAWVIVLISGVTGLLFLGDGLSYSNFIPLLGAGLILVAWVLIFRKFSNQVPLANETNGDVWQVPFIGAGLATLYGCLLQLLRNLATEDSSGYDFSRFISLESAYFFTCLLLGILVLSSNSISNSQKHPNG